MQAQFSGRTPGAGSRICAGRIPIRSKDMEIFLSIHSLKRNHYTGKRRFHPDSLLQNLLHRLCQINTLKWQNLCQKMRLCQINRQKRHNLCLLFFADVILNREDCPRCPLPTLFYALQSDEELCKKIFTFCSFSCHLGVVHWSQIKKARLTENGERR